MVTGKSSNRKKSSLKKRRINSKKDSDRPIPVFCGELKGDFLPASEHVVYNGHVIPAGRFEEQAGKQHTKKWRDSIKTRDGQGRIVKLGEFMKGLPRLCYEPPVLGDNIPLLPASHPGLLVLQQDLNAELRRVGLAVVWDEGLARAVEELAGPDGAGLKEITDFLDGFGVSIFHDAALDADGAYSAMLYGTHQRVQAYLDRGLLGDWCASWPDSAVARRLQALPKGEYLPPGVARIRERMDALVGRIVDEDPDFRGLRPKNGVIIGNRPGPEAVASQCLHSDLLPGQRGLAVISSLDPGCSTLVVAPYSHLLVDGAARMVDPAQLDPCPLYRLQMQPGQLVILDGNTVHAGDRGVQGQWSPRVHFYVQAPDVKDETYPVAKVLVDYRRKLVPATDIPVQF